MKFHLKCHLIYGISFLEAKYVCNDRIDYGFVKYNEDNIDDTLTYSINGNVLMRKTSNHVEEGIFAYSITGFPVNENPCPTGTGVQLFLTGEEEIEWKQIVDFGNGPIEIDIHLIYSDELTFYRVFKSGPIQN